MVQEQVKDLEQVEAQAVVQVLERVRVPGQVRVLELVQAVDLVPVLDSVQGGATVLELVMESELALGLERALRMESHNFQY